MLSVVYVNCHLCSVSHISKPLMLSIIMLNVVMLSVVAPEWVFIKLFTKILRFLHFLLKQN
jgi:hypothetical protein